MNSNYNRFIPEDGGVDQEGVQKRFKSLVGSPKRKEWLPKSIKVWSKPESLGVNKGEPPVFWPDYENFPPSLKSKTAQPAGDKNFQVGLCAYDCWKTKQNNRQLAKFLRLQKDFISEAKSQRWDAGFKRVRRLIQNLDSFYSLPSVASK